MLKGTRLGLLAASAVAAVLAVGAAGHAQGPEPKASPDVLKKLEFRLDNLTKSDCSSRCERPLTQTDQIYCCTVCLEAQFICTRIICRCEVPLPGKIK